MTTVDMESINNDINPDSNEQGNEQQNSLGGKRRTQRKRQGRKWNTIPRKMATSLSLLNKRYRHRREIMPGVISFQPPIYGQVIVEQHLEYAKLFKAIHGSLQTWGRTCDYQHIRSIKGILGKPASYRDDETLKAFANELILYLRILLNHVVSSQNFERDLEDLGIYTLSLPSLIHDLLHIRLNYSRVHKPVHIQSAHVNFIVKETKLLGTQELAEALGVKNLPSHDLSSTIAFFERAALVSSFMPTVPINDLRSLRSIHPNFFNAILSSDYNPEDKESPIQIMIADTANEADVGLAILSGIKYVETTLRTGQIDTYAFCVSPQRILGTLRRFITSRYFGIVDNYIAPSATELDVARYELDADSQEVIGT